MIYSVVRYHVARGNKILLVVPTTSLVEQMFKDFQQYGWDAENHCHRIYALDVKESIQTKSQLLLGNLFIS